MAQLRPCIRTILVACLGLFILAIALSIPAKADLEIRRWEKLPTYGQIQPEDIPPPPEGEPGAPEALEKLD